MRKIGIVFTLLLLSTTGFSQEMPREQLNKLLLAAETIYSKYVDSLEAEKIVENAIEGVLKELDPHSNYLSLEELKRANESLQGNFEGIGIQFNILDDTIFVVSPISGGPSEKLGIRSGDKIIQIEDEIVAGIGITNTGVAKRLRGEKGTIVNVEIKRNGESELIPFRIERDKIPIFSLDASYMMDEYTGYIKLNRFSATTLTEFEDALFNLKSKGMKNLILDLQGNGGGYLNAAIALSDHFLSRNKLIVFTEGKANPRQEFSSTPAGAFESGKLVVLIDESSASASEIVTGAVQDWDRALVVGRRSFGKGLVQRDFKLNDGSSIRMTMARYYTPSGRSIQKPFKNGREAYAMEINDRFENGELFTMDSINFPDSLQYKTNAGRIVYGGGGILPDVFIPLDTSANTQLLRDLIRKGILNNYTLEYVDQNREKLESKYSSPTELLENFKVETVLKSLLKVAEEEEVIVKKEELKRSEESIKVQLQALIARNLWGTSEFYEVINTINPTVLKGLEKISSNNYSFQ